ncbi:general amino acid permease agp2 [Pleurotus ostreatus]|nr:general amino acid permease agp2 [Pleurotus ostreatus]
MVTWIPISSPFIRRPCPSGINFFVYEAILIPFEVTAFNLVLHFWTDKIPVEATIAFVLVLYVAINFFAVKWYGESEFWLSLGKVILAASLIFFTFITMVGGNPLHDVYGFCNWDSSKVPGAPFAEYIETGSLGRFLGFLTCLIQAAFTMVSPDYISMTAGKAVNPRCVLPKVFNSVIYRLATFFVVGSLCVGIVILYNNSNLKLVISDARPGAGSSPYVIAMERLQIPVLPHLVNAMILLSVFSAGNTCVYCASRTLFGLALEGKMPRVLTRCTKSGVPVYAVMVTIGIALLSFLQVLNGTVKVLQWFVHQLGTASQLLNYMIISYMYIHFHQALKEQNIPRESLPKRSFWQPFCAWYAFIGTLTVALISGYEVFLPGRWDVATFFFSYTMISVLPILYVFWKVTRHTRIIPAKKYHSLKKNEQKSTTMKRHMYSRHNQDWLPVSLHILRISSPSLREIIRPRGGDIGKSDNKDA